jgi:hypothetical protein
MGREFSLPGAACYNRRAKGGISMPAPRLATSARKLEDLPSDGGAVVDTISGALLRVFVRLNQAEAALTRLSRRVAALEGTEPEPATGAGLAANGQAAGRPDGRPQ